MRNAEIPCTCTCKNKGGDEIYGIFNLRGGIHPYDGKDLSKNCPVEKYLPKGDLAILVSQHIGAPAKPIVKKR